MTIDGVEADLGKFSEAIYKKIIGDAKRERFQGFRPGTIPPHLEPTYRAFSLDECVRETVLEALQQNNIRPFQNARAEFEFVDFSIPPPIKKRKKGKKRKRNVIGDDTAEENADQWLSLSSMQEVVDAGWRPGQSVSFVAKNCKGQLLRDQDVDDSSLIGGSMS